MTPSPTAPGVGLLPCPFCGSTNLSILIDGERSCVLCYDCKAYGPLSAEEYKAAWNRRSQSAAVVVGGGAWQARVIEKLARFAETTEDEQSFDIGTDWANALVLLGLLSKPGRGRWQMTAAGDAVLSDHMNVRSGKLPVQSALCAQPGGEGFVMVPRDTLRRIRQAVNSELLNSMDAMHQGCIYHAQRLLDEVDALLAPTRVDVASGMGKGDGE